MATGTTNSNQSGDVGVPGDSADYPALDPKQMADLAQVLPPAQVLSLVQSYCGSAISMLAELDQAAGAGNWQRIRELAHDLKGSSGSFGAARLRYLAETLEQMCADGRGEGVPALIAAMGDAIGAAQSAIEGQLAALEEKDAGGPPAPTSVIA